MRSTRLICINNLVLNNIKIEKIWVGTSFNVHFENGRNSRLKDTSRRLKVETLVKKGSILPSFEQTHYRTEWRTLFLLLKSLLLFAIKTSTKVNLASLQTQYLILIHMMLEEDKRVSGSKNRKNTTRTLKVSRRNYNLIINRRVHVLAHDLKTEKPAIWNCAGKFTTFLNEYKEGSDKRQISTKDARSSIFSLCTYSSFRRFYVCAPPYPSCERGQLSDSRGQLSDSRVQLSDSRGQLSDSRGQLTDST